MRAPLIVLLALFTSSPALAEGFAKRDLTTVAADLKAALGNGYEHKAEPKRVTLICPGCQGEPMIDVLLGRQTDGTEDRVRSGQTSMAQLERLCQQRSPECRLAGLQVAPAVGWITTYPLGSSTGSTAVILKGGDLLTIRSLSSSAETALTNAETIVREVAPKIVGP